MIRCRGTFGLSFCLLVIVAAGRSLCLVEAAGTPKINEVTIVEVKCRYQIKQRLIRPIILSVCTRTRADSRIRVTPQLRLMSKSNQQVHCAADPGRNRPKIIDLQREMAIRTSPGPRRGRGDKNKIKNSRDYSCDNTENRFTLRRCSRTFCDSLEKAHIDCWSKGCLKAVWPDFLGAFLKSGRPRGPGKALKNVAGLRPSQF